MGECEDRIVTKSEGDTYGYRAARKLKYGEKFKYPLKIRGKYKSSGVATKKVF